MIKLKQLLLIFGIVGGLVFAFTPSTVGAVNAFSPCSASSTTKNTTVCGSSGDSVGTFIRTITNTLLFIIGAVSVIVIIFGGFQYATSGGDSSRVASAKNTIMYAIIGLIVAILAYAIVNFVIKVI